jgi:hypothetical protein
VLGFYIKTPRGFSRDRPHYRMLHIGVCVSKENLRIKISGLSCVIIFMNNDPVHFIHNAFKDNSGLSLELNKIQFYA